MIRLAISVEGQTEEDFVKSVLADHLRMKDVETTPIQLGRGQGTGGGGNVRVEPLTREMVVLRQNFDAVTSLVDFYGFRDKGSRAVEELEDLLAQLLSRPRAGGLPARFRTTESVYTARRWQRKRSWRRFAPSAHDSTNR